MEREGHSEDFFSSIECKMAAGSQPPLQQGKRKTGANSKEADPRANKKIKDKAYRERVKETQLRMKEERDNLVAEKERLERENEQLNSNLERAMAEKKQAELEAENRVLKLEKQLSEAIAEKKLADYKNESLRRELQSLSEQIQLSKAIANLTAQGSTANFDFSMQSTTSCSAFPAFHSGKTLPLPNYFSSTIGDVNRRLEVAIKSGNQFGPPRDINDVDRGLAVPITSGRGGESLLLAEGGDELSVLVKDSAGILWKFRCSTQVRHQRRLQNNDQPQVVLYEWDLSSGANYRSEAAVTRFITIVALDLVVHQTRPCYEDEN